ncbi:MAG: hypothetical protein MJ138_05295 [Kiritimatiellae bacterium]|nr:hypothetical protein [Kiritimatiellia bacterium]
MKKLLMFGLVASLGFAANAGCWWSWWVGDDKTDKDLVGCQLGIASECKTMKGAQVSILWNRMQELHNGAQLACGYNNAKKVQNGPQVAVVNIADKAALQFGLLCFNKGGFLPFFVFFNFDKTMFGGGAK